MIKALRRFDNRTYLAVFFLLFGLVFARYCYFGFEYYFQLDDYIQYHNFTAYCTDLPGLIKSLGLLSARPLAGLADIYVWSGLNGCMIVAVAIISAMYAASAVLLHKVFEGRFGTGWLFFVVYALLPVGFEGTYWLSASTRIVVGLFFAALALFFFDAWCRRGRKINLAAFAVLQLLAYCFYEQIVLFSGAATLIVMLCEIRPRNRRALWGFWMFPNAAIYFLITKLAPAGINSSRAVFYFPWQEGYFENLFLPLSSQVCDAMFKGNAATLGKGLLRGFELLISEPNILYAAAVLALCGLLFLLAKKIERSSVDALWELLAGLFLAAAPVLLFYVLKGAWFSFRNLVPCFCGLALVADAIFDLIFGKLRSGRTVQAVLVSAFALLCCVASISEISDYKAIFDADSAIATAAGEVLGTAEYPEGDTLIFLNVDASYVNDSNIYFHEHGYGATGSDWAFTGAVRAFSGRGDLPTLTPISSYRPFYIEAGQLERARVFFYVGSGFVPAELSQGGDGLWSIEASGQSLGVLKNTDMGLMLELK